MSNHREMKDRCSNKLHLPTVMMSASLFLLIVLWGMQVRPAWGQSMPTVRTKTPQPVSLAHLYWHFLVHQHDLDMRAVDEDAQGRDGTWLRKHLQTGLGFSETDFVAIRTSSARLSAEVKALDEQAAKIKAAPQSAEGATELKALSATREVDIQAEISALKQSLSSQKIVAMEAFMAHFFAPKTEVQP